MDHLAKPVCDKIHDIVSKLQKMDCSLLGNKDDAWIMELFFQAGFHRYHLIEWILSKLEYDIKAKSGPQNSEDERLKILQKALLDLGIWRADSHDIVKGNAKMQEQLEFWCLLVNILWTKYEVTSSLFLTESDEGLALSETDQAILSAKNKKYLQEEYEDSTYCINNILDSINLEDLLKDDLDLLAPDVEREIQRMSASEMENILNLQQLKEQVEKSSPLNINDVYKNVEVQKSICVSEDNDDIGSEDELNQLENAMLYTCSLVQDCARGKFTETCNELKPLILHAKAEEFIDVGLHFQKAEKNLQRILKLKKSFPELSASYSKLVKITTELESLAGNEKINGPQSKNILSLLKED